MKKIFGILMIFAILAFAGSALFAADATVTYVSGKVEVQRGSSWVALKVGDLVHPSEVVSTGFQSEAKVKLADSIMYMGPLTRVTLEQLSSTESQDNVNVYLKTGAVRSQVNHKDNKRVNYQVRTSVAVASARGTNYSVSGDGTVIGYSGVIAVAAVPAAADTDTGAGETPASEESGTSDGTAAAAPAAKPVLLKANQSLKVTASGSISAPVNTTVQAAATAVSAVSTASAKESVSSAASAASTSTVTSTAAAAAASAVETPATAEETKTGLKISVTLE